MTIVVTAGRVRVGGLLGGIDVRRCKTVLMCFVWLLASSVALAEHAGDGSARGMGASLSVASAATTVAPFDAEAATRAYLATMTPAARARSDRYFEGGYWLLLWDAVVGLGVCGLLLGTRLSVRMREFAERLTRRKWLQTAVYGVQYFAVTALVTLPWSAYEGYFREHQYGMSNLTLAAWLLEQGKGLLLMLLFGTLALVAVYAVIRRLQRSWWLWGALVAVMFMTAGAVIGPTYLEPVFNRFYPLADGPLKEDILSLARANGIPASQVYEYDASKQTTKVSAHVSGMFGSVQISLNDNLMNRSSPAEVKAVLGHEMGHYVLNHAYKGLVWGGIVVIVGFAWLSFAYGRVQARYARRWGIGGVSDVAGLPLLVALFTLYGLLLTPLENTVGRTMEAEADAFGLNAAREPDGFAQAALQLSEYRKMAPGPVEEALFYDHPSGWNRIHRAMVWKAESLRRPATP
jgi:STE24 endopeptidase